MTASSDELVCPKCGGENVEPARARGLDHLVTLVGSHPFVCDDCGERFRSTINPEQAFGLDLSPSQAARAVCPNCQEETVIRLTPCEQEMAVDDGWVISCPGCCALYAFIRPTASGR